MPWKEDEDPVAGEKCVYCGKVPAMPDMSVIVKDGMYHRAHASCKAKAEAAPAPPPAAKK